MVKTQVVESFNLSMWSRYIESQIGFVLPQTQQGWLFNAVHSTSLQKGLTIEELWQNIQHNHVLKQQLIDKVLIPESRFFRHMPSLEFITQAGLAKQQNSADDFRVWSVGCATGQEVWSLAMCLQTAGVKAYQLVGTDVSQSSLQQAKMAVYTHRQQQQIPNQYQKFTMPVEKNDILLHKTGSTNHIDYENEHHWKIVDELKPSVRFIWHNIFLPTIPVFFKQDAIICQNVLIYFREFDQRDILSRLVNQCALGCYLILAPGEALMWRHPSMQKISHPNVNAWQKICD